MSAPEPFGELELDADVDETVVYSDHARVDEAVRANLCQRDTCHRHGAGEAVCPIPTTWGGLRDQVQ